MGKDLKFSFEERLDNHSNVGQTLLVRVETVDMKDREGKLESTRSLKVGMDELQRGGSGPGEGTPLSLKLEGEKGKLRCK